MTEPQNLSPGGGFYEPRAVAFVDLLGFKTLVQARREREIHDVLHVKLRQRAADLQAGSVQMTAFSDCVVISNKLDDTGFGAVAVASVAGFLALELMTRSILVRGGMTVGELFHQQETVFGPALISAYEMESQLAQYPRILACDRSRELVEAWRIRNYGPGGWIGREAFRRDFDGLWHFDLFGLFFVKPDAMRPPGARGYTREEIGHFIMPHVENLYAQPGPDAQARTKHEWLMTYTRDCARRFGWTVPIQGTIQG